MTPRWADYYIDHDFEGFWRTRLADKGASVCVILGVGFDPRSLVALERIARCGTKAQISFIALHLSPPSAMSDAARKIEQVTAEKRRQLNEFSGGTCLRQEEVRLRDENGYLVGGRAVPRLINESMPELAKFRDVIVDISGLPRTIFFPLISFLCKRADQGKISNLHVVVTEDSVLDSKIHGGEYGTADYIYPFRLEATKKLIWLPVVSESESGRLQKIHNLIEGDCIEVCPILPFPSRNLRRSDDILVNLRDVLFERILVSKNNLLLCDERTPFDIYRKIIQMDDYYRDRLTKLPGVGEVTTVVSPLASKMLSLGMLLAAFERHLPVAYVEAGAYRIDTESSELSLTRPEVAPVEVWLTGEPYNVGTISPAHS